MVQPPPAYVTPLWLATCAAAVHVGGTDSLPTSVLPAVFTETPTFGALARAGAIMPVTPSPPAAAAPAPTELTSARALVIAGVMSAGLTYEPEMRPFKKVEFRKVPMELPSEPSKKSRILSSGLVAAFVAEEIGEVSCCNDAGIAEVSCCSCACTPAPVLAPVACVTAEDCML